ncbi:conserved oligomeric Golgi complex subunit 3 [Eurytemora carolleeae]|uniref:conserved oligomeric Golgi complex subunit 3 n=1 Tax=Eurytemora carolleeae TaxID=1294199 RepID=UPI000C767601|nr:conserved oligomeric Golgi complex subunit 3 [Eurytemora carolleeae]|eukprot:XP_023321299.1 conserved oligomeric Golgi complex subunit 3-like [Eurytemora affinis]
MESIVSLLSDWDSIDNPLTALSSVQLDTITDIANFIREPPLPRHIKRSQDPLEAASSRSVTSDGQGNGGELLPVFQQLESGKAIISTGQQFLQWIHQVESSLLDEESKPYHQYIAELERQRVVTLNLQNQVSSSLGQLEELTGQYEMVSKKTTELHVACQHLLQEQTKLSETNNILQEKLKVFQEYEKIVHKLGSPTLSVQSETFLPLLSRIDESITYLQANSNYKESTVYLVKYRAALNSALDMIRTYVKSCLDSATAAASVPASPALSSAPHTAFTLFYGKFRAAAPRMRHLIAETERRKDQGQEYEQLLTDVEQHYLACRERLLGPSVRSAVSQLLGVHQRDHCGLVRAGCAFLLHVCEDETQLHAQMFSAVNTAEEAEDPRPELSSFLERLCLVLYDSLRPLIIQVSHLETLAELTAILRGEVIGQHCVSYPYLTAYRRVGHQMLQDVQERLVYRTSVYIRTDITGYKPSPGDLAYPEKLEMMESIAEQLTQQQQQQERGKTHSRQNSNSSMVSLTSMEVGNINSRTYTSSSPADLHGMWYPPVRRTLLTLSKLYRCLEKPIFQGLSQEVLLACLDSVQLAAEEISKNPKKSKADGQLFEIKHLLTLREQIAPFQADFMVKETSLDFSKITSAAVALFNRKGDFLTLNGNNSLLEFLLEGTPGVQEHLRDSKKEVDRRLKHTCESFIQDSASSLLHPVQDLNTKVLSFYQVRGDKSALLKSQPWAADSALQAAVATSIRLIKSQVPMLQRKMQLYLANRETEFILFRPIRSSIISTFVSFISTLRTEYTAEQQIIVGCPTQEQLAAILASVSIKPRTPIQSLSREVSISPENKQISRENSQVKETLQQIEEAKSETSSVADSSEKIQESENQKIRNSSETSDIGNSQTEDQNEQ